MFAISVQDTKVTLYVHALMFPSRQKKKKKKSTPGFYYGLSEEYLRSPWKKDLDLDDEDVNDDDAIMNKKKNAHKSIHKSNSDQQQSQESISIQDILGDTLSEFKSTSEELRDTLDAIRQEIAELSRIQKKMLEREGINYDSLNDDEKKIELAPTVKRKSLRKQREYYDKLAEEVEEWATHILFKEGVEEDGWKDVECSKLLGNKYNKEGKIKCFLKWLPDSRNKYADPNDKKDYPCIRCYTTLDAPIEQVCRYLADEKRMQEYNDLVIKHNDLEDISPHSKICWGQCPQILFIKPRDFITFCHHRWKKDGTQVVINQAVDHEDAPTSLEEGKSGACRAYALRGANFISKDPSDPNKTRLAILAHGNPGGNLPPWACKAAVNAVVPIEPFKLFYNIEKGVKKARYEDESDPVIPSLNSSSGNRSSRPGGLSQLGYACFWPDGGGLLRGNNNDDVIND